MTTAWTWAAHLHPWIAFRTQPMGFVLFLAAVAMMIVNVARFLLGWPAFRADRFLAWFPPRFWWSAAAALLAAWVYKALVVRGWV